MSVVVAARAAGVAVLVGCGEAMRAAIDAAAHGASGGTAPLQCVHVVDPIDAVPLLRGLLGPGDVVIVKGSRSMTMERIVTALARAVHTGEATKP